MKGETKGQSKREKRVDSIKKCLHPNMKRDEKKICGRKLKEMEKIHWGKRSCICQSWRGGPATGRAEVSSAEEIPKCSVKEYNFPQEKGFMMIRINNSGEELFNFLAIISNTYSLPA